MTSWLWIVKDKRFNTRATLPYILGAQRVERGAADIASEEISRKELEALLISMRDDLPAPDCVAIQHCSYIDAYVAARHPAPLHSRSRIQSPYHADRALYHCDEIDGHRIHDLESLVNAIWSGHKDYILQGHFSREGVVNLNGKRKRDWVSFDDCESDERGEIRKTLANPNQRTRSN